MPHFRTSEVMRVTMSFRLDSRSSVPRVPRKYFDAVMLTALLDQWSGNSTPFCSKDFLSPLPITASRRTQVSSSNGWTPALVWRRFSCRR